jgi:hypothetical protein
MPRVGFEPTIPGFEREKTVHALDSVATLIGEGINSRFNNLKVSGQLHAPVASAPKKYTAFFG